MGRDETLICLSHNFNRMFYQNTFTRNPNDEDVYKIENESLALPSLISGGSYGSFVSSVVSVFPDFV